MCARHIVAYLTGMRLMPRAGMPERTGWDVGDIGYKQGKPRVRHQDEARVEGCYRQLAFNGIKVGIRKIGQPSWFQIASCL